MPRAVAAHHDPAWALRSRPLLGVLALLIASAPPSRAATPNLACNIDRPLRYHPDGGAFVIDDGRESFNRPLYGYASAFRVDAGDRPELSLYLPGKGGNLRVGVRTPAGSKWFSDAAHVTARYGDASMRYEIRDPLLGDDGASVRMTVVAMDDAEGVIVRVERIRSTTPATGRSTDDSVELIWACGGVSGERGRRDGDIGTEREPVSAFFAPRAEASRGNRITITNDGGFMVDAKAARIRGATSNKATVEVADARHWSAPVDLLASAGKSTDAPLALVRCPLPIDHPIFLAVQRMPAAAGDPASAPADYSVSQLAEAAPTTRPSARRNEVAAADLPALFDRTEQHWRRVARQVVVDTPDAFVNAAVPALCAAADGVWDERAGAFMHGAVAWRVKLLGWRGAYAGDALGQHDRTRRHLANWFSRQNDEPVTDERVGADADTNLSRSERRLHSNGDLSRSHYDMNLVAIDAMFRHLLWTGDRDYARSVWPVIVRHLAWERRLFRREFGDEKLPLYEAYACIWASDELQYSGGGATHATAYNYFHNRMAARVAEWIGEDPAPYRTEAELIRRAMQRYLWLDDAGHFAECKDLLGEQLVHPAAALWTHYNTIDSRAADPVQAWQMGRYVDTQLPHIPLRGAGIPGGCFTLATTRWMPYTWSTNNVVMAETMHAALADFEARRFVPAFAAFKGALLDSMYTGLCPGNVGMCTGFDAYRGESQRDFADAVGVTSRAMVEGLFGITPDAIAGELLVRPGFPAEWDHASIDHPDVTLSYRRDGATDTYVIEPRFPSPMKLRLHAGVRGTQVAGASVNGQPGHWQKVDDAVGSPGLEVTAEPAPRWEVTIRWQGDAPATPRDLGVVPAGERISIDVHPATLLDAFDPQHALANPAGSVAGHRSVFARVRQGEFTWQLPIDFEVRPLMELVTSEVQDPTHLRFRLRNNTSDAVDADAHVRVGDQRINRHMAAAARSESAEINLEGDGLVTGTNPILLELPDGRRVVGDVTNWTIQGDASHDRFDNIDLSAAFNDRVTRIFQNEYLVPRSPYCSLSMPRQGFGGWCTYKTFPEIDDAGLRDAAARNGGVFTLPQGVPFRAPIDAAAKNIAFVSQWHNFPPALSVPLNGRATHAYFLLAGSTNPMQSQFENGEIVVTYADGTSDRLPLVNPTNWWPIEQDYFIDDFAFARPEPLPPRVELKTGTVRGVDLAQRKGRGGTVPGGAATVLDLPLDPSKELRSLTLRARANEVVIGLMSATLQRPRVP